MLQNNDYGGIIDLANDRLRILQRLPGSDPSDTMQVLQLTQSAQAGNPEAQAQLSQVLGSAYQQAISRGYVSPPAAPKYLGTEEGMLLFQNPDGTVETRPISQDQEYVPPKLKEEARREIRDGVKSIGSLSKDALEGYRKLEGLGGTIRAGQGASATDQQKRAARQALATGLTIMARMASPGVVTEQDFRNLAGGSKVGTEFLTFLQSKGDASIDNLLAAYDPTDPDKINVDMFLDQAGSLLSGTAGTLLNQYAGLSSGASNYSLNQAFVRDQFSSDKLRNLNDLAKIYRPDFDTKAFFVNPSKYLNTIGGGSTPSQPEGEILEFNSEQEADFYANTTGIPDGTKIVISDIVGTWTNK